jgi:hypothetical protein
MGVVAAVEETVTAEGDGGDCGLKSVIVFPRLVS